MKWILINNHRSILQEFHLIENDACEVIMKYNPIHRSVRISCDGRHKLFFIENTGSLTGKFIFKNEYGMNIGNMSQEKWFGKDGIVTIEAAKYTYTINENLPAEFIIYEGMSQQKLVNCVLIGKNDGISISSSAAISFTNCLLLGLCWYLSLSVIKQNRVEHAA